MTPEDLGPLLLQLRNEKAISLRKLARLADMAPASLSAIENGQSSPTLATLHKLLKALGQDFSSFFAASNAEESPVFPAAKMKAIKDEHRRYTLQFPRRDDLKFEMLREVLAASEEESEWEQHDHDLGGILLSGGPLKLEIEGRGEWTVHVNDAFYIKEGEKHRAVTIGSGDAHLVTSIVPRRY